MPRPPERFFDKGRKPRPTQQAEPPGTSAPDASPDPTPKPTAGSPPPPETTPQTEPQPTTGPVGEDALKLLAQSNFAAGLAPFDTEAEGDLSLVPDPLGSGRTVARMHYVRLADEQPGVNVDRNRSIRFVTRGKGVPQVRVFRITGKLFLPEGLTNDPQYQRKLIYPQRWPDYTSGTFPGGFLTPEFWSVLVMWGLSLNVAQGYLVPGGNGADALLNTGLPPLRTGAWNDIGYMVRLNSAFDRADGRLEVASNGQVWTRDGVRWSDERWIGKVRPQDQQFEQFMIGDQVNSALPYDEFRYWDDVKLYVG